MSDVLFCAEKKLCYLSNGKLEAEVLLGDVLGVSRAQLKIRGEQVLSIRDCLIFERNVWRRSKGVPLAYIRGWQEWGGMKLKVSPSVLIPRDETEYLLEKIVAEKAPETVLDVGTGSGCLALGIAREFLEAEVTALDYSSKALKVARANFSKYGESITALRSDLLSGVDEGSRYDLIVANLPYVPAGIMVTQEVKKEPQDAIFSGEDGLDLLRRFARELQEKEITFSVLWLEFLPKQWPDIKKIFGAWQVEPVSDLGGDIYFARVS